MGTRRPSGTPVPSSCLRYPPPHPGGMYKPKSETKPIQDNKDKAQILVEQFFSVFTKMGNRTLPILQKCFTWELPSLVITSPGIEKLLKDISTSKAIGPDKISNVILKHCASQLAPGLAIIYQGSADSGSLPSDYASV